MASSRQSCMVVGAAIAVMLWQVPLQAADKEPIRIGVTTSLSGPYQAYGGEIKEGVQFAVDEANAKGGVDGRKVEVEFADEQGDPDTGRREAGKLALKGYKLLMGGISSAVSLAISGQTKRLDALYIATLSKTNLLTGKDCNDRTFRTYQSDAMDMSLVKPWLKEQPQKKWAILAADYAWGRDSADSFTASAVAAGKTVMAPIFAPFGAKDFAAYITQLKQSDAEAVWIAVSGADFVNFWKQAKQFGLIEKMRMVAASAVNTATITALGNISEGMQGIVNYSSTLPSPSNQKFVKEFRAKYSRDPGFPTAEGYLGVVAILGAVAQARSVKPADVAKAMSTLTMDTPMFGKVSFRPQDNQLATPNFFGHVGRVDGELKPVIDTTFTAEQAMPPPSPECRMR